MTGQLDDFYQVGVTRTGSFTVEYDVKSNGNIFSLEEAKEKKLYCLSILLMKELETEWEVGIILAMERSRLTYRRVGIFQCNAPVIDPRQVKTVVIL